MTRRLASLAASLLLAASAASADGLDRDSGLPQARGKMRGG